MRIGVFFPLFTRELIEENGMVDKIKLILIEETKSESPVLE
jgi:hypothetical protein